MSVNEGYEIGVNSLQPRGTNSTMFTQCCNTAICDSESQCPACGQKVIGSDAETNHERNRIRWNYATSHWNRKTFKKR